MSADTPRPIGRTPRQVAGPEVDDRPTPGPDEPDPLADGHVAESRDVTGARDPDVAEVDHTRPDVAEVDDDRLADQPEQPALADPDRDELHEDPGTPVGPTADPWDGPTGEAVAPSDRHGLEGEAVTAPEPGTGPDGVVGATTGAPEPYGPDGPGSADMGAHPADLRQRWERVQVGFVDDPRRAVEEAHEMVAAAVAELQAQIDRRRDELGGSWRDGASTDELLRAFQGYRDLFDRVLSI